MADLPYPKQLIELVRNGDFASLGQKLRRGGKVVALEAGDSIGQGGGRGMAIIMDETTDISPVEWEKMIRQLGRP